MIKRIRVFFRTILAFTLALALTACSGGGLAISGEKKFATPGVDNALVGAEGENTDDAIRYSLIRTEEQLRAIGSGEKALKGNYKLASDIVLEREWSPLGSDATPFNGKLDGNGFSVKNISMAYGADYGMSKGFFAKIGASGEVRNIGFIGRDVSACMRLAENSGVIAGINDGLIENVFTSVSLATSGGFSAALVGVNNGVINCSYAIGATATSNTLDGAGVVGSNEHGTITKTFADAGETGITKFCGKFAEQDNAVLNANLLTTIQMKTAETFSGWNTDVWHLQEGHYPLLKTPNFVAPTDGRSITIVNSGEEINVSDYDDGYVPIKTRRVNAPHVGIEYSMTPAITGVTLDALTGVLHFDSATKAGNGQTITLTAKLEGTNILDTKNYRVLNDGYNDKIGVIISTEAELYDNLIVKSDRSNEATVATNMTRKLKLGANIELVNNKAWPGVSGAFAGSFDGCGYTISGLAVPKAVASNGYGFFMQLKGANKTSVMVQNLTLKGSVDGSGMYVSALARELICGTVQNVKVDVSVDSTNNRCGKIIGYMSGDSVIKNCIALGHIGSSLAEGEGRPTWGPYACGAIVGYPDDSQEAPNPPPEPPTPPTHEGHYTIEKNIAMLYPGDNASDIGITIRKDGFPAVGETITNNKFVTEIESLTASTYTSTMGFNTSVWDIANGMIPELKYPGYVIPTRPVRVIISNTKNIYDYQVESERTFNIAVTKFNTTADAVFAIEPAVSGISVNTSGVVTIASSVAHNSMATIKATIGSEQDTFTFRALNDTTYDPAVGALISNEQELYDNLIVKADKSNEAIVARNLGGKIKLSADIVLTGERKAWPGVSGTFTGNFNGRGYSISGLDAPSSVAKNGYGFFMKIESPAKADIAVENLELYGSVDGHGLYVAGLAKEFTRGTIQNVLVDMSVTTNSYRCGKIVGFMDGNSQIIKSIGKGHMQTSLAYALDPNQGRPSWGPYAMGAFIGFTGDTGSHNITNNVALRFAGDADRDIGFTIRSGNEMGTGGTRTSSDFVTAANYLSQATFTAKAFEFGAYGWQMTANGPVLSNQAV